MKSFLAMSGAVALGVAIGGAVLYGLYTASPIRWVSTPSGSVAQIDYQTFISIMLTAVTVVLAGLGFVVAVLAFIGWNSIGNRVSALATTFLKAELNDGGSLHNMVKDEVKEIMYGEIQPVDFDYEDDEQTETEQK
ncbi:hypothetical protein K4L04_12820 [Phaeobacter inhibens]|uniref:hypothetical protein n=1 Tax=Phaeobacter inhibens TaxID=221822 RepID=UPI0021A68E4B|nr:hypothetical protein [Phaeobacter inhibens]UWR75332.1 hypothetical protein K4L04_12820 [Phaeobacter inhibens]